MFSYFPFYTLCLSDLIINSLTIINVKYIIELKLKIPDVVIKLFILLWITSKKKKINVLLYYRTISLLLYAHFIDHYEKAIEVECRTLRSIQKIINLKQVMVIRT